MLEWVKKRESVKNVSLQGEGVFGAFQENGRRLRVDEFLRWVPAQLRVPIDWRMGRKR